MPDEAVDQVVSEASVQAARKAVNSRAATGEPASADLGSWVSALHAGCIVACHVQSRRWTGSAAYRQHPSSSKGATGACLPGIGQSWCPLCCTR